MRHGRLAVLLLMAVSGTALAQDSTEAPPSPPVEPVDEAVDTSFEIPDTRKKPFTLTGYLELRPTAFGLDRDASQYRIRYGDRTPGNPQLQANSRLQWDAAYEKGASRAFVRGNTTLGYADAEWATGTNLYEAYGSHRPNGNLTLDAGKKTLKWGKGYAWNPVAFVDRPKNPEDPELAQEGFIVASADYIRSLEGPLKTVALTPVLIPVLWDANERFGRRDTVSVAGKVYLLYEDTDIDLMCLAGDGRSPRFGVDFSRNLSPNLELHGEYAWLNESTRPLVDSDGRVSTASIVARSHLLGIRYLTSADITWIVEYYHNGAGYRADQMRDYFRFVDAAYTPAPADSRDALIAQAESLSEGGYGRQNPMRDYLYVRASKPDAFGVLYLTPAAMMVLNLNDRSFSITQEATYKPVDDTELRLQLSLIVGSEWSEYGEKQNDLRMEFRSRFYF